MVERLANTEINARRISHVESCFGSSGKPLFHPSRVLVGEGVLTKLCRKKPKARQFFLFNDVLVYGNIVINKKRYNKQSVLSLRNVRVEEIPDNEETAAADGSDTLKNGWLIISPSKSFAVYAQTAMEKEEWLTHMTRCIDEEKKKSGPSISVTDQFAPTWVPDSEAVVCMRCKKTRFTTLQRKHHCRKCGLVVCNACSTKKCIIQHQSAKPLRVCDVCYQSLQNGSNTPEVTASNVPNNKLAFGDTSYSSDSESSNEA
uniref:Zinc finger protein n=1 Tax=Ciona intestinalis TaxID=7719 RepID=Q1RL32_CIOIN|nr:zinc finger protein ZF9 [Ciona intestinalis]FAA00233.1 TPA: zinc finger protein [Ciona intestinalis]|eukprot:NP_001041457.1 zinc finger protein ZF9 [Ciona intestinalis]